MNVKGPRSEHHEKLFFEECESKESTNCWWHAIHPLNVAQPKKVCYLSVNKAKQFTKNAIYFYLKIVKKLFLFRILIIL